MCAAASGEECLVFFVPVNVVTKFPLNLFFRKYDLLL